MSLLQTVQMEDQNEDTVTTTMYQLLQWKHALKAELKGIPVTLDESNPDSNTPIFDHLIKFLSVPKSEGWSVPEMYNYICQTMQAFHEIMYEDSSSIDLDLQVTPEQVMATLEEAGYEVSPTLWLPFLLTRV